MNYSNHSEAFHNALNLQCTLEKQQTINAVTSHMTSQRQHELMLAWLTHANKNNGTSWQASGFTLTSNHSSDSQKVCIIHRYDHGGSKLFRIWIFLMNWTFMFKSELEIIITMMTFTLKLNISSSNAAALCLNTFICCQYECRHAWIANPLWFPTFKYSQRSRIYCTNQK